MAFGHGLNPRQHLTAAIGWAVFIVVTVAALIAASLAAAEAEKRARADAEGLLAEFATQVRDAVSMNFETRRLMLQALAAQVSVAPEHDAPALRNALIAAQSQSPEFAWMGAADDSGHLVAETGSRDQGADVSALLWFLEGRQRSLVTDLHAPPPGLAAAGQTPRLIDVATPLPQGGTLVGFLAWDWVDRQVSRMQRALNRNRQVELMLTARDGTVLVGPPGWVGRNLAADGDATEGGAYVIGTRARLRLADDLGLGWTAIVRQRAELALAPVKTTRNTVFAIVFAAGLLSAAAAAAVTRWLTRRLTLLAREAEAVRRGDQLALAVPAGADEVSRIGATLAQVVDHLQAEKQALQTLNAELDRRVAERTARIERMADEARHAAVTRERLRIARDLHDTLAHSLMALLTQIRVVRKLRARLDSDALDAELGHAETVATTGLAGARAAIAQMRDNGVRDTGLGPALQDLVRRFAERTGTSVSLTADEQAAKASDERAETVFRIVEEALRNVERHSGATSVRVALRRTSTAAAADRVQVEVADDGMGFDPALPRPGHFGLRGMQEQAALIGAQWALHSGAGQGTRIVLEYET